MHPPPMPSPMRRGPGGSALLAARSSTARRACGSVTVQHSTTNTGQCSTAQNSVSACSAGRRGVGWVGAWRRGGPGVGCTGDKGRCEGAKLAAPATPAAPSACRPVQPGPLRTRSTVSGSRAQLPASLQSRTPPHPPPGPPPPGLACRPASSAAAAPPCRVRRLSGRRSSAPWAPSRRSAPAVGRKCRKSSRAGAARASSEDCSGAAGEKGAGGRAGQADSAATMPQGGLPSLERAGRAEATAPSQASKPAALVPPEDGSALCRAGDRTPRPAPTPSSQREKNLGQTNRSQYCTHIAQPAPTLRKTSCAACAATKIVPST